MSAGVESSNECIVHRCFGRRHRTNGDFDTPFPLTGGATLPTWRLAYETYGTPNTDMSNAVLVCHALSGSQHAAGRPSENSKEIGWWDNFIGPGKPVDTNKFFVVSSNNLGGCHGSSGPSSPHPQDGRPYGSRFPVVTVEDWVRAQKMLRRATGRSPICRRHRRQFGRNASPKMGD